MLSIRVAAPLMMLLLSSCVVGPDYKSPEIALPSKFGQGSDISRGDITAMAWWTAFNDPKLNSLVDRGLAQNLSIIQAIERIEQAEASVVVAGSGGLPALNIGSGGTRSGTKGNLNQTVPRTTINGQAQASWVLDLFGEYRRATESANASLDAAYANVDTARLTLLSQVAAAYIDARYFQERIALAKQNLGSRRETLDLTKLQLEAGAASRLDVVQSEGLVNSTLSDIPVLEISYFRAVHRIATLLGLPASSLVAELQKGQGQPVARRSVMVGIPADLIRNRPDIRRAERDLAAATAQIGVAEANLYPTITLGGSISPTFVSAGSTKGNITSWSFGPSISLPILDGGRLLANVDINNSIAREQYIVWKTRVLNGIEEVENALAAVNRDSRTVAALRATVKSYQEALSLSTASYRDGASSLLDVLDAQRSVSDAQARLAAAVQQMAQDYVSLNVALGGGYRVGDKFTQTPAPVVVTKVAAKNM